MESKVKKLLERVKRAKEKLQVREGELRETYRYVLPSRDSFRDNKGQSPETGVIYDSTAKNGIEKYATKLQNLLTPAWEEWSKFQPGSDIPEEYHGQVQAQLDKVSEVVFSHIHHSNFYTAEHEAFLDLGISTGAMVVERNVRESDPSLLNFRSIPLSELIPECSTRGTIDTVWREFKVKAVQIEQIWPKAKIHDALLEKRKDKEDMEVKLYEGVVYNDDKNDYTMYVLDQEHHHIMLEEQMDTSPFIVFRESVRPGDVIGFGRAMRIIEDIKTLNKLAENSLRADGLRTLPMFTAVDDGAFNPYNIVLQPGTIIPVASNSNDNPSLRPLQLSNDYQYNEARMQYLQGVVNETFLANPYGSIEQTPVRSATEIAAREADLFQSTASAFGRLQTEFLEKILRRSVDILKKEGKLPAIEVDGREVSIKFTSPFAKMQGSEKVKNIMQWLGYVLPLGSGVANAINLDKVPFNLAKNMGIDKELYKDANEIKQLQEQMAQAMAQQAGENGVDMAQLFSANQANTMPV
jgi:hypothetical protein